MSDDVFEEMGARLAETITTKDAYSQSCDLLRHYSQSSGNIRTLCVAQGMSVLGGCGALLLLDSPRFLYASFVALFGLLLALFLFFLHSGYLAAAEQFARAAAKLESNDGVAGPLNRYLPWRGERYGAVRGLMVFHGTFIIVAVACAAVGVHALIMAF